MQFAWVAVLLASGQAFCSVYFSYRRREQQLFNLQCADAYAGFAREWHGLIVELEEKGLEDDEMPWLIQKREQNLDDALRCMLKGLGLD